MIVKVMKRGNGLAFKIPDEIVHKLGLKPGCDITITAVRDRSRQPRKAAARKRCKRKSPWLAHSKSRIRRNQEWPLRAFKRMQWRSEGTGLEWVRFCHHGPRLKR